MTIDLSFTHSFPNIDLDISFNAPAGVTVLFGRSGSGKTTAANVVAGLLRPDSGRVVVEDTVLFDSATGYWLPPHRRRIGYVFQEGRLFPHMTVRKNLGYGSRFAGTSRRRIDFDHVIALLGIEDLLNRQPGNLSGGEKQRVAIGRALLSAPQLLIMDEPLASLDNARKAEILPYLARLHDDTQVPVLYVSHSVSEVARLASTIITLSDGKVVDQGTADAVLSDPEHAPLIGVREAGAVVSAVVLRNHPDGLSELAISGKSILIPQVHVNEGTRINVRIRAQDVILTCTPPEGSSALNSMEVEIIALRQGVGPGVMVQLRCGNEILLARLLRRAADMLDLSVGTKCYATINAVAVAQDDVWE